jgi:CyaY protein
LSLLGGHCFSKGSAFSGAVGAGGTEGKVNGPRTPHPRRDIAAHKRQVLDTIKSIFISLKVIVDYSMANTENNKQNTVMSETLSESTFYAVAEKTLIAIETSLEDAFQSTDLDLDISRQGGNVVNIQFEDKSVIVVNTQAPLMEIWVAAKEGGFHYRWAGTQEKPLWLDTKTNAELFSELSRLASQQAKTPLKIVFAH